MARILLSEDDLFIRDIYSEVLRSANYQTITAVDGEDALEKIKQGNWDILFLDVIMPKRTGIEVLKEFNKEELHTLAKHIILMTNTEETRELHEISDLYDDFILKSAITPGDLLERVKLLLKS